MFIETTKPLTITESAQREIAKAVSVVHTDQTTTQFLDETLPRKQRSNNKPGVRIKANGGLSNMTFSVVSESRERTGDSVSDFGRFLLYVDRKTAVCLEGVVLDYNGVFVFDKHHDDKLDW